MFATIQVPTHCPSCDSTLEFVNDLLYCRSTSCKAQSSKKVEHFAKTLKIKGLGPKAIEKLGLQDFDQVYALSLEEIAEALGSEKLATKLYAEIENSRSAPLELVLPAFGIPLIGNSATAKLSETVDNLFEINADKCKSAGLGPKATETLLDWLNTEYYCFYDGVLPFDCKFTSKSRVGTTTVSLEPTGIVCITGKLKSFSSKAEAKAYLEHYGYIVKSTLTKDCTHLINESGIESTKTKNARAKGIIVTTIGELINSGEYI